MKTPRILLAALAAFSTLLPAAVRADGANEIVSVAAKGYGTSVETARRNAGRNAIEQVVGSLVDAETLVENDAVIRDKVLAYSAAVIESMETVGDPEKNDDGLYVVNVLAKVRKTQIAERLKAENVSVKVGSEFTDAIDQNRSKADQEKATLEMIAKAFNDFNYPFGLMKAEPVPGEDGKLFSVDRNKGNEVFVIMDISVDTVAYAAFVKNLMQKLDSICTESEDKTASLQRCKDGGLFYFPDMGEWNSRRQLSAIVIKPVRKSANAVSGRVYRFNTDYVERIDNLLTFISRFTFEMEVTLLDSDGELIGRGAERIYAPPYYDSNTIVVKHNGDIFVLPFVTWHDGGDERLSNKIRWRFSLGQYDEEDLKEVTDLKWKFIFKDANRKVFSE